MKSKIGIIIRREYLERVQKKSFIITTILMPIIIVALMIVPALIMAFQEVETKTVAVIDESGIIAQGLEGNDEIQFVNAFESKDSLLQSGHYFGVLTIDADILSHPSSAVKLYTTEASSLMIENMISSRIQSVYESEKLKTYDIPDLDKILADIDTKVTMQTFRTDRDEEESQSSGMSYAIGMTMEMILYMLMFIYGAMVMNSIIEEKNNRVLELVVSSVKPRQLMLGKIVGIGLVAVTQIMIWAILICVAAGMLLPALIPADMMAEAQQITSGAVDVNSSGIDPDFAELAPAIVGMTNVWYIVGLFGYLIL
ncbi:MAG: ABC transporter permease, partial [Muribaculaceae bacterium]|nr:ABC transporter permease [Muribaculaceae bacterium]